MSSSGVLATPRESATNNLSAAVLRRPMFQFSDIWRAPLTDLPIRDEILYQYLPLSPEMHLLEIGPGSGFTAFRLSRQIKSLMAVDVAKENVVSLEATLAPFANVKLECADVCLPGLAEAVGHSFDVVEAIEVFEFLPNPKTALQNMASVLRPGGRLFLQFPNYRPPKNHGVTYFDRREELDNLLRASGFKQWEVFSLHLRPYAQMLFDNFHERPLKFYRWLRRKERPNRPQTFQNVWAFRHKSQLERYKFLIHIVWLALIAAIRLPGDCFTREQLGKEIMDHNLLVIAER
jgi:SAM-dependent methyltransferase